MPENIETVIVVVLLLVFAGIVTFIGNHIANREKRARLNALRKHLGKRNHHVRRSIVIEDDEYGTTFQVHLEDGHTRQYTVSPELNIAREDDPNG